MSIFESNSPLQGREHSVKVMLRWTIFSTTQWLQCFNDVATYNVEIMSQQSTLAVVLG